MKHIKVFEDYSEEELRDLQDTLHDIGHNTKFIQGEDFGFGTNFKGENDGIALLRISKKMFDFLLKRGELKNFSGPETWKFSDPEKFGIPISDNWLELISSKTGQYYIETDTIEDKENIIKKLGEIRI